MRRQHSSNSAAAPGQPTRHAAAGIFKDIHMTRTKKTGVALILFGLVPAAIAISIILNAKGVTPESGQYSLVLTAMVFGGLNALLTAIGVGKLAGNGQQTSNG